MILLKEEVSMEEYSITEFGETLRPIIMAMCDWGKTYKGDMIK